MDSIKAEKSPGFIGLMNTTKVEDKGVTYHGYTFDNRQIRQNEKNWIDFLNEFSEYLYISKKINLYEHRSCEIDGQSLLHYIKNNYYRKNKFEKQYYSQIANDIANSIKEDTWQSNW